MTTEQRNDAFSELESEECIIPVQVEGIRTPLYMLVTDISLMQDVLDDTIDRKARLEFLAPLDPMLWDRKLIDALWDYLYSWEIYTPAEKRKYGYYVLPMLYGENLIGRIEAIADRKAELLDVRNVWYEKNVKVTRKIEKALSGAVTRLARFNGFSEAKM